MCLRQEYACLGHATDVRHVYDRNTRIKRQEYAYYKTVIRVWPPKKSGCLFSACLCIFGTSVYFPCVNFPHVYFPYVMEILQTHYISCLRQEYAYGHQRIRVSIFRMYFPYARLFSVCQLSSCLFSICLIIFRMSVCLFRCYT